MNLLDASIVCISVIEIIFESTAKTNNSTTFTVFRMLRVLRIFKLSTKLKTFNEILNRISATIKDILTFFILMVIFEFVFIILGMQFFANTVYLDEAGNLTDAQHGSEPALNFNTITNAFVSVFIVFIGDDWPGLMFTYQRQFYWLSLMYFNTLIIVANMILLNLFLAILLSEFDKPLEEGSGKHSEVSSFEKFRKSAKRTLKSCL